MAEMNAKQTLEAMGFNSVLADKALLATQGDIGQALDWIEKNQDVPGITDPATATPAAATPGDPPAATAAATAASGDAEAEPAAAAAASAVGGELMLRCTATGKVMTVEQAKVYSARTGHTDFEQTTEVKKPLTAEEKAAKKKELEAKMKERKAARLETEATEAKQKEKMRRTTGKQIGQIKLDYEQKQAEKAALERKREKIEAARAKKKILEELAKDKAERAAARVAKENAKKGIVAPAPAAAAAAKAPAAAAPKAKKEYTETRIQVRAPGAKPVTHKFQVTDTVAAVFEHVRMNLPSAPARFVLGMTRPRRDYTEADFGLTLTEAELVPSAALNLKPAP